jgi:hypothetical protein
MRVTITILSSSSPPPSLIQVYCGLFPVVADQYELIRDSLGVLKKKKKEEEAEEEEEEEEERRRRRRRRRRLGAGEVMYLLIPFVQQHK